MNKNDDLLEETNTQFDQNSNDSEISQKDSIKSSSKDIYSTKDEKLIKNDSKVSESRNSQLKDSKNIGVYEKNNKKDLNKSIKTSRLTIMVQKQIKDNFSLDNLGKLELAEEHRSANRPLHKIKDFNKKTKFCQCCNLPCIQSGIIEPFSFKDSVKKFAVCGKGIYLYFFFISYAVFCFFIIFIISSISFIIINNKYYKNVINLCKINDSYIKEKCDTFKEMNLNLSDVYWSYKYSIDNLRIYKDLYHELYHKKLKPDLSIINYSIINCFSMLILLFFNILCFNVFHYFNNKLKNGILPSDYTLLITNLNHYYKDFTKNNTEQYNIEKFTGYLKKKLFESENIHSINICYKINDYMKAQKLCEEYKYKIFQIKNNPYQIEKNEKLNILKEAEQCYFLMPFTFLGCSCSLKKQENLLNLTEKIKIKEIEIKHAFESEKKLNKFAGCIFVTFNTVKDKENYYNKYPHYFIEQAYSFIKNIKNYLNCFMDKEKKEKYKMKKTINVFYAHEPEDVIWENMEYSLKQRIIRGLLIYFISLLLLLILFFIVFRLTSIQNNINKKEEWNYITINIFSYLIALAIVIVNKLFQLLLEFLTEIEKPNSYSNLYLSCSVKLTMFSFITSSIIPYICNTKDKNLMVKNISNLFIVNSIVLPMPFTLITYFYKSFRICLIKRKPNSHCKTQKELNDLYELPDMDISYKYSDVCQTILMTFFYMSIFPFGAIISSIGLILTFFCQKFYFIHFYKRPEMLNESICKFYLEYFIFDILIYAIGDYIFSSQIYEKKTWCLFNLILFTILSIIHYNKLIIVYLDRNKIIGIDSTPISKVYFTFYNDYERQNPLTKKEGLCKYINTLREKKYISERVKEIATNNVENINIMEVYYRTSIRHSLIKSQFFFADKNNFINKKRAKSKVDKSDFELDRNNGSFNSKKTDPKNKENENKELINLDKTIIEDNDFMKIMRNNNSLMLETYKNPFLFGINDSIRLSLNLNFNKNPNCDMNDDKYTNSVNPNLDKNENNILNKSKTSVKFLNKRLDKIKEESCEQDPYNNYSGIMNVMNMTENDLVGKIESKDSHCELDNKYYNLYISNNPLYKSLSLKKSEKSSFNDLFNIGLNNQTKNESKEGSDYDLTKSAIFKKKNSFNEV